MNVRQLRQLIYPLHGDRPIKVQLGDRTLAVLGVRTPPGAEQKPTSRIRDHTIYIIVEEVTE